MSYPLSIAMATYNGEKYIKDQLISIFSQTYEEFEVVVCDDNSNDGTIEIISSFLKQYKNIRLIKNSVNLGYIKNFERAINHCEGEYIALCDQDDIWFPEKLSVLMKNIGDKLLIHSDASILSDTDNNGKSLTGILRKNTDDMCLENVLNTNIVTGCTTMIKKSLALNSMPFPESIPHDHWLAICAANQNGIKYIEAPLIYYRRHQDNTIGMRIKDKDGISLKNGIRQYVNNKAKKFAKKKRYFMDIYIALKRNITMESRQVFRDYINYYNNFFRYHFCPTSFFFLVKKSRYFSKDSTKTKFLMELALSTIGLKCWRAFNVFR